jgi:O-antigen ligase
MAPPPAIPLGRPWEGVTWSLLFVGFLVYLWVAITFSVPIGEIAMAAACLGLVLQTDSFRIPWFLVLFGLFIAWSAVGMLTSSYPDAVLTSLDTHWRVWLIGLVAVNALRSRANVRFFIFFYLAAFALYPVRGTLISFFIAHYNVFGRALWNYIYSNPNDLAALSLLPLSLTLALLVREPKGWPRLAAWIGAGLLPFIVLLTQSRGAILGLGVAFLLWLTMQQRGKRMRTGLVTLLIAMIVAIAAPGGVWHRMAGLKNATDTENLSEVDAEGSAEARYGIWRVAVRVWRDAPITGAGLGAYSLAHQQRAAGMQVPPAAHGPKDTHSTYLNVLAETGVPGLLLFLGLVASVVVPAERARRRARDLGLPAAQELLALECGLFAFLVAGIFGSFAKLAHLYVFLSLLWCVVSLIRHEIDAMSAGRGSNHVV